MQDRVITLPSFAKINWFLKVGHRRNDGFHEVCTALQTISLHDTIRFERSDSVTIESSDPALPLDERNLVHRAAEALGKLSGVRIGAKMRIEKRIPYPGGLGGGSSNAAIALLGLSKLLDLRPGFEDLSLIASELGSDVPFFLLGGAAVGTGTGSHLEPLPDMTSKLLLILSPEASYSTAEAYRSLGRDRLTSEEPETKLMVCRELAKGLISGNVTPHNDFEDAVSRLAPETVISREWLVQNGAIVTGLTGSGPGVFGIFENESRRKEAIEGRPETENIRIEAAQTVGRAEYRDALGPCGELLPSQFS